MLPFEEVTDETWQILALILGKPSLLSDCVGAVSTSEASPSAVDASLKRLVSLCASPGQDGRTRSDASIAATHPGSVQWGFIAQALGLVRDAFAVPDSFEWTDTAESTFSDLSS